MLLYEWYQEISPLEMPCGFSSAEPLVSLTLENQAQALEAT